MQGDGSIGAVVSCLTAGLTQSELSPAARRKAQLLLERLQSRVRLVIAGPRSAGKSQLATVLLGHTLPANPANQSRCYSHVASNCSGIAGITSPSRFLENIDLIDLAEDRDPAQIVAAVARADIVLWATTEFSAQEAAFWKNVPDSVKDHSILVLTQADKLATEALLQDRFARLSAIAHDEFHNLVPTSTLHAFAALLQTGSIPDKVFAASGVKTLSSTITRLAREGRQADQDAAMHFIARNSLIRCKSPIIEKAAPLKTLSHDKALALLRRRVTEFGRYCVGNPDTFVHEILEKCCSIAEELVELVTTVSEADHELTTWHDDIFLAADKITLMAMEDNQNAAADAVTIIAQLKRDLDTLSVI